MAPNINEMYTAILATITGELFKYRQGSIHDAPEHLTVSTMLLFKVDNNLEEQVNKALEYSHCRDFDMFISNDKKYCPKCYTAINSGDYIIAVTRRVWVHLDALGSITNNLIKDEIGDILTDAIGKHTRPECKIMELYKNGIITWEDTIEAHSTDCSL